jgi:hypothetical protein
VKKCQWEVPNYEVNETDLFLDLAERRTLCV